ncbi:hypothetical protein G6514_000993 [Epicoccum nigrum]|nr:hypothetical protein G6514_000993 [Epicoccum nigrum]
MSASASSPDTGALARLEVLEAITKSNQENSPLLRLPAEIRNQIYAYVCDTLTVDKPEGYEYLRSGSNMHLVCRQIKDEATNMVKQYFIVQFSDKVDIKAFNKLFRNETVLEMEMQHCLGASIVEIWEIDYTVENADTVNDPGISWESVLREVFCNHDLDVVFT